MVFGDIKTRPELKIRDLWLTESAGADRQSKISNVRYPA